MTTPIIPTGFTPHDGEPMPVDVDTFVDVILRSKGADWARAHFFEWENWEDDTGDYKTPADVIAYRVHVPQATAESDFRAALEPRVCHKNGITLRDWFAAMSLHSLAGYSGKDWAKTQAEIAYVVADAMLSERSKAMTDTTNWINDTDSGVVFLELNAGKSKVNATKFLNALLDLIAFPHLTLTPSEIIAALEYALAIERGKTNG